MKRRLESHYALCITRIPPPKNKQNKCVVDHHERHTITASNHRTHKERRPHPKRNPSYALQPSSLCTSLSFFTLPMNSPIASPPSPTLLSPTVYLPEVPPPPTPTPPTPAQFHDSTSSYARSPVQHGWVTPSSPPGSDDGREMFPFGDEWGVVMLAREELVGRAPVEVLLLLPRNRRLSGDEVWLCGRLEVEPVVDIVSEAGGLGSTVSVAL